MMGGRGGSRGGGAQRGGRGGHGGGGVGMRGGGGHRGGFNQGQPSQQNNQARLFSLYVQHFVLCKLTNFAHFLSFL